MNENGTLIINEQDDYHAKLKLAVSRVDGILYEAYDLAFEWFGEDFDDKVVIPAFAQLIQTEMHRVR